MTHLQKIETAAQEITLAVNKGVEKLKAGAKPPPPGTFSKHVAGILTKYFPEREVSESDATQEYTAENIYAKPPVPPAPQANTVLAAALDTVLTNLKTKMGNTTIRVNQAARELRVSEEVIKSAIALEASGLEIVQGGWIKAV